MPNLYQLNTKIEELKNNEELDLDVLNDTLDSLEVLRDEKLDNIASWIESNKKDIEFYKDKCRKLSAEKQRLEKQNERLMNYLTENLDIMGVKELKTDNHILRPRNYQASLDYDKNYDYGDKFMKIKREPDVTKIKEAIKNGENIPHASLKPNRKVVIK